uniref:Uncharacterized protein n=1 Tax=Oryza brachyantha TaxID=4533 RepID=J3LXM0_ORYBR
MLSMLHFDAMAKQNTNRIERTPKKPIAQEGIITVRNAACRDRFRVTKRRAVIKPGKAGERERERAADLAKRAADSQPGGAGAESGAG